MHCKRNPHHPPTHSHVKKSLSLAVAEKGAKLTGEDVVVNGDEEMLVELESRGKLNHQLPNTIQELSEDWGCLSSISGQVTTPVTCAQHVEVIHM